VTRARRRPGGGRPGALAAGTVLAFAVAGDGGAQTMQNWRIQPYVTVRETLTSNVNLAPSGREQRDLITEVTPGVRIDGRGPRVEANGTIAARTLTYLETGNQNNVIYPQANIRGRVEALRDFFFVEAQATVVQQYLSPLGTTSFDTSSGSNNRYTAAYYRVSPYIEGDIAGGRLHYLLRNDNTWTNTSGASVAVSNAYTNNLVGLLETDVDPFGWALDANRNEVTFSNQEDTFLDELVRLRLRWRPGEAWRYTVSGGYEWRDYPLDEAQGVIYGAGVEWRPGERTQATARWEERIFGPSYFVSFDHRLPGSAIRVFGSRNITSYPQLIGSLSGAGGLESLVGAAFITRFPDPVERQAVVDQFLRTNALPGNLATATPFYSQQVLLQETQSVTYTLLGARHSLAFTVFHQRNQPIAGGSGVVLPEELSFSNDNDQRGGSATFSQRLSGQTAVNFLVSMTDVKTYLPRDEVDNAKLYLARVMLNHELTAKTTGFAAVRAQRREATISTDYREAAVYVGVTHRF
jgi:uncharacterized protein (PEP-CTERM system associated)